MMMPFSATYQISRRNGFSPVVRQISMNMRSWASVAPLHTVCLIVAITSGCSNREIGAAAILLALQTLQQRFHLGIAQMLMLRAILAVRAPQAILDRAIPLRVSFFVSADT